MQRYTVNFNASGLPTRRLLVPFSGSSTVKDFAVEVGRRLARLDVTVAADGVEFYLGDSNGPQIDPDDPLEAVILDSRTEELYASVKEVAVQHEDAAGDSPEQPDLTKDFTALGIPEPANGGFKIRLITPSAAQQGDISSIAPIPRRFPTTTTVHQIRQVALHQLGLTSEGTILCNPAEYCHCTFASGLHTGTTFRVAIDNNSELAFSFLFVYDAGKVVKLSSDSKDYNVLRAQALAFAKEQFGDDILEMMCINVMLPPNSQLAPVAVMCSNSKHGINVNTTQGRDIPMRLDLHTAEGPIDTSLSHLTMAEIGLEDILVEGVLNLYALSRKDTTITRQDTSLGQATIFGSAPHWEPQTQQTERGMAIFLSTLRVVSSKLGGHRPDLNMQDAILSLFHKLTSFPPSVRALHILVRNETPAPSECAAIAQTLFHALEKHVPMSVINFDKSRLFEVSRLFFGLFLEKAKHICRASEEDASHPYLTSLKPVTLTNPDTMDPLFFPVDTNVGLLEQGHLAAVKAGLVKFVDASLGEDLVELTLDGRTRRAILLSGGRKTKTIVFDMDILYSNGRHLASHANENFITPAEMELSHLAALCNRQGLTVVAPARLATSSAPALTLNGEGLLSCYLGRQPCSEPGKDFVIFQPTQGGDKTIDIAIITQLLAPILGARHCDGSAIFDAPGDAAHRKIESPDEILMVCVDCSASMGDSAGFIDMVEDLPPRASRTLVERFGLASETSILASPLDEVKEWIMAHESFDDIVHTVHQAGNVDQSRVAKELLDELAYLAGKELQHQKGKLSNSRHFTYAYRSPFEDATRLRVESLKKLIVGTQQHQVPLTDWIVFRSRLLSGYDDEDWVWHTGNLIPGAPVPAAVYASDSLGLSIPDDFRCAITYELMSEPVATADGHVYDRAAIQQWLQINNTSPKTGLELPSTRLTANRALTRDINKWIDGDGHRGHSISRQGTTKVTFSSRLGTFERTLKLSTTCTDLYHVVFQALRGRHPTFDLRVQGRLNNVTPNDEILSIQGVRNNCIVNITLPDSNATSSSTVTGTNTTDKCLIKVYHNTRHCLFSYWVPKASDLSVASILFKYWRRVWGITGSLNTIRVWSSMSESGDNHFAGRIRKPWEKLSTYLVPAHARGSLEEEDVFEDESAPYQGVLKVYIGRKPEKAARLRTSRMDVCKQIFDQFVNRTIAYNYNTHLGLVVFDSTARVARQLTDVVEDFRATVNQLQPSSDTAIWDGLALARHQLNQYGTKYPQAKKRILCISDGEDTKSTREPANLCADLVGSDIIVDSFCLGREDHSKLLSVSYMTGGYKFVPKTLSQAMSIVELEPVLALQDREDIDVPSMPRSSTIWSRFQHAQVFATPETITEDVFPRRRAHPSLGDDVIEIAAAKRMASSNRSGANMLRNSRLLTEIQNIIAKPHDYIDVYVSECDISFWKVIMRGPPDSPYASGTFLLYLDMDQSYPAFAPKGRFVTPIYHVNVNPNGRICHSICVDRNWTADTSCADILNSIYGLLLVPDYSDPVNVVGTLAYHGDQVEFADAVRGHITKHASKSRAEWRRELLGHD